MGPDDVLRALSTGARAARRRPLLAGLAGDVKDFKPIIAYHGSGADFDRFDASKIGSGQGSQAFGHGLYFAGSENVAKIFRNMLSGRRDVLIDGKSLIDTVAALQDGPAFNLPRSADSNAMRAILGSAAGADTVEQMLENARVILSDAPPHQAALNQEALELLASKDIRLGKHPGHVYEVELGVPEESLLDWDAPLSQQPKAVQNAYGGRGGSFHGMLDDRGDGERLWWNLSKSDTGASAAAEMLDAGIPGVRYLEAKSRRGGQGTRNYVMFPGTEDSIKILRKYGLLAPVAAGAAMEDE